MKKKQGKVRLAFWLPADAGEWVRQFPVSA
jgi:hypothetical protein